MYVLDHLLREKMAKMHLVTNISYEISLVNLIAYKFSINFTSVHMDIFSWISHVYLCYKRIIMECLTVASAK